MRSTYLRSVALSLLLAAGVLAGVFIVQQPGAVRPEPPGVSHALARERSARVSDVAYDLRLRVPAARTDVITGSLTTQFTLENPRSPLVFDFAQPADHLLSVSVNGEPVAVTLGRGHITLPAEHLTAGRNVVAFEFIVGDAPLNRQDDLLYSLSVPARASQAFPCFDQPDLRARWRLALDVPRGWSAVSNGRETGRVDTADHTGFLFDETLPIPTYLFAFAAGRFDVETAERDGRIFRLFHRETDNARIVRNRDAIFEQHANALAWMEEYTAIPYRFGSFDMVLLPAFQFSGMEHPGVVYYNADAVLLDPSATQSRLLARANVIAHETAHMWFGNLVTMKWFDDVWLKEVFANFMAARIVNPSFPEMDHDLRFLVQHYPAAYEVDRTAGANPIRQPLFNLAEAGSLYGAIIYQKAPIVLRQLELLMGPDQLQRALRDYLSAYEFGSASWSDLVDVLDRHTPRDVAAWSRAWIEEPGRPTLVTDLRIEAGTVADLSLRQSDSRGRSVVWPQHLQVLLGYGTDVRIFDVVMDGEAAQVAAATGLPQPDWVLPLGGGIGYGIVELDEQTRGFLTRSAHTIEQPLTRTAAFIARWEAMLDGQIPPTSIFDALLRNLEVETNELTLQVLLDQVRTAFWRFTPAEARQEASTRLEPVLRAGLDRARTSSEKAAWFTLIRSTATSDATIAWLDDVWARRVRIDGLVLSEVDETDLALDLAVRAGARADDIIAAQIARIQDADRRARLQFIAPAVSPDARVRTAFFESLRDPANRSREAWVLDAARYLHHPLRAEESQYLVRPALDLVREIQRTGDIFFPKRWADATLSGYQSPAVAVEVRQFLETLPPDYPRRLRWVVLSAADPLFRAAALLAP